MKMNTWRADVLFSSVLEAEVLDMWDDKTCSSNKILNGYLRVDLISRIYDLEMAPEKDDK